MDGRKKRTEGSRNHRGKTVMLGISALVFLGVLLTGCFALGYKGVGAPGPTVPVKKTETVKKEQPALPEKKETPVESLQKKQEEPKAVDPQPAAEQPLVPGKKYTVLVDKSDHKLYLKDGDTGSPDLGLCHRQRRPGPEGTPGRQHDPCRDLPG